MDGGLTYSKSKITVSEYFESWLSTQMFRLRLKTGPQYQQIARDYILPIIGDYKLKDMRIEHVEALYRKHLTKVVGVRSTHYVHSVLHRCLQDAVQHGVLTLNPAHGMALPCQVHF